MSADALSRSVRGTLYKGLLLIIIHLLSPLILKRKVEHYVRNRVSEGVIEEVNEFKMFLSLKDEGICRDLFLHRRREPITTDYLFKSNILKEGHCALDIGGNIGYYALIESRLVGKTGIVYAVEPVSKNVSFLKRNIKLNGIKNVQIFRLAIGHKNETAKIFVANQCNLSSMMENPNINIIGEEEVNVVTVDRFLEGKNQPNLIRMDVEGYEYNIIKGMEKTLKRNVGLLIEVHGNIMTKDQVRNMIDLLKKNKFEVKFSAVEDRNFALNKIAELLARKMNWRCEILRINIDDLKELLMQGSCVQVLFSKS